jgi:hypothetical protein
VLSKDVSFCEHTSGFGMCYGSTLCAARLPVKKMNGSLYCVLCCTVLDDRRYLQELAEREVVRAAASGNMWYCASHPEHVRPMLQVGMCHTHACCLLDCSPGA